MIKFNYDEGGNFICLQILVEGGLKTIPFNYETKQINWTENNNVKAAWEAWKQTLDVSLGYNASGIVASIAIRVDGIYCPLEYNSDTKTINFALIEYVPTKNILQTAWQAFIEDKNLENLFENKPDLAVEIVKYPQWELFIKSMFIDETYNTIVDDVNTSTRIVTRLETACTVFLGNPTSSPDLIIQFFNQLITSLASNKKPSVEIIDQWNKIAIKNSMNIIFNNNGLIEKI